jgi:cytochrome oxidase Cu insertion factor (SCO1/SenC/PrrC family)
MPGMNSGLNIANPILVAAFRTALVRQGLIALLILTTLAIAWASVREWLPYLATATTPATSTAGASAATSTAGASAATSTAGTSAARASAARGWTRPQRPPEAVGRAVLRIGFGLLWILDGILQAQPAMVAGLPSKVIEPAAATSPAWVQHVVNWAGTIWSYHPIQASSSAVWIQVGIGVWLVTAARGRWSRLAGLVSVGWGLIVWAFGEAFGGLFAPGLTVLFGAPGAALLYCVAGTLVALPDRRWQTPALGRWLLSGAGLFLVGMAVLQGWPGRGFWQGSTHGQPGTLTAMIQSMAGTPQPSLLAHWVTGFGTFTALHGFAVNLFAVIALATIGVLLLTRKPWLIRPAIALLAVFCLADWILIEDIGFLGGLGTDPNNMIPLLLVVFAGYLGMARLPATAPAPAPATPPQVAPRSGWRENVQPRRLARGFASAGAQGILACWAAALVLLGAAPMALAQANPNADPIIAEAIGGTSAPINFAAPGFALTDQHGRPVSLASLRGKVVLMTFLDPVCTTDCPLIAQEFRAADEMLGARAAAVQLVAVATNPLYYTAPYLQAFDRQERLAGVANWHFLTGSLTALRRVWRDYGISAVVLPAGEMVGHDDLAFVIDAAGRVRYELNFDPGPGTATSQSSFAVELSQTAEQLIHTSRSSS